MTEGLKAIDGVGDNELRIRPFRLGVKFAERIWGKASLEPWYSETGTTEKVGEAWLTGAECVVETGTHVGKTLSEMAVEFPGQLGNGEYPLLVKMLFPEEKLSVQVHPDDEQAALLGLRRGKTECWYVLEAVAGAKVACGLVKGVTMDDLKDGIAKGTAEDLLEWLPVSVGDMVFVDAGTVHAIGPGAVLLEVQQMCDVTYRLYDYGRPRELHLEAGLAVVKLSTGAGKVKPEKKDGFTRLIEGKYFVVDRFELHSGEAIEMSMDGIGCVVMLQGEAAVNEVTLGVGQAVVVPSGSVTVTSREGGSLLRCFEPS